MHRRPFCGHTLLVPLCSASIAMPTQEHPMAFDSDQPRCSCSVFKYLLYQNEGVSMTHCVHRGGKLQYKRAKKKRALVSTDHVHQQRASCCLSNQPLSIHVHKHWHQSLGFPSHPRVDIKSQQVEIPKMGGWGRERKREIFIPLCGSGLAADSFYKPPALFHQLPWSCARCLTFSTSHTRVNKGSGGTRRWVNPRPTLRQPFN